MRDKKIGLSKKPPKLEHSSFQRIKATTDEEYLSKDKKSIFKKILSARKKDPFIYE
jgi:precorrin isomerase